MNERTVMGESTKLAMLSMMTMTLRFVTKNFIEATGQEGTMRERLGESTSETKMVADRRVILLGTSSTGFIRAFDRIEIKCVCPCLIREQ